MQKNTDLPESIESINEQLLKNHGKMLGTEFPIWRVVWSDDQLEHRKGVFHYFDDSGNFQRSEVGVKEVRKYEYLKERYILERIMPLAGQNAEEIKANHNLSYEPVWVFEDAKNQYLPPLYRACDFVIHQILKQAAKTVGAKYKDPDSDPKAARHNKSERVDKLIEDLFGNETATGDLLNYKEGIAVPSNYEVQKINETK